MIKSGNLYFTIILQFNKVLFVTSLMMKKSFETSLNSFPKYIQMEVGLFITFNMINVNLKHDLVRIALFILFHVPKFFHFMIYFFKYIYVHTS
jgi:hypothetical protein